MGDARSGGQHLRRLAKWAETRGQPTESPDPEVNSTIPYVETDDGYSMTGSLHSWSIADQRPVVPKAYRSPEKTKSRPSSTPSSVRKMGGSRGGCSHGTRGTREREEGAGGAECPDGRVARPVQSTARWNATGSVKISPHNGMGPEITMSRAPVQNRVATRRLPAVMKIAILAQFWEALSPLLLMPLVSR